MPPETFNVNQTAITRSYFTTKLKWIGYPNEIFLMFDFASNSIKIKKTTNFFLFHKKSQYHVSNYNIFQIKFSNDRENKTMVQNST